MNFIIGVLIGGVIVYFFLRNRTQDSERIEQTLRQQLRDSEAENRRLASQVESMKNQAEDVATCRTELQAKTHDLQQVTDRLSAAEEEINALREQLAAAEMKAASAADRTVSEVTAELPPSQQPDDLKKIEGIGPKVSQVLNKSGILTFAQLAQTDVSTLREILQEAGPRFKIMEPESWPEQAGLAAKGAWDDLTKLQAELDGGKYRR